MMLRLRINVGSAATAPVEPLLFRGVETGKVPKPGSIAGSLLVHVLVIGAVVAMGHYVAWLHEDDVDWSRYEVEPLRLHLAEPLIYNARAAAGEPPKAQTKPAPAVPAPPAGQAEPAAAAPPAPPAAAPRIPRRLELPVPRQAATNAPIILQPDFQPQLKPPPVNLPPMAFWARQDPVPPKPPVRSEVVLPGRKEAPSPAPQLNAPPVLAVPNREPVAADVNVSLPPVQRDTPPALPVANSATMPVRLRDATDSQAATFDRLAGQPVNVMSLASERPDVRDVTVPKGVQNIPRPTAGDGPTGPASPAAANGTRASTQATANGQTNGNGHAEDRRTPSPAGSNQGGTAAASRAATAAATQGSSTAGQAPATPSQPQGTASQAPANPGQGGARGPAGDTTADAPGRQLAAAVPAAGVPAPIAPARGGTPPGVTRIDHPVNGNFDVVVTQSAPREDLSELGAILTGNPVYSVYLPVGDRKEWLLEYCVPSRQQAQVNPYQVDVEEVGTITPPYPISTVIPNSVLAQPITKHIVLHGFLTAAGILRGVGAASPANPLLAEILALLGQWQFRPALRNSRPIDVEILLVIPTHG